MLELRRLFVLSGTVSLKGGDEIKTRTTPGKKEVDGETMTIQQERKISPDRRRANSLSASTMRELRRMCICWTPYGRLVAVSKRKDVQNRINRAVREIAIFNAESTTSRLSAYLLLEELKGARHSAVQGWLTRQKENGDRKIAQILDRVVVAV